MQAFAPVIALAAVVLIGVAALVGAARLLAVGPTVVDLFPHLGGRPPVEHAVSRFHVRWYAVTMIFLAFDMEMIFMYPWTVVVATMGPSAVVEMFLFLAILLAGVVYAWREGALRWT
ncbi:NADH-quinone oxidoreductase subunit A [Pseudonocardia sediminis]|uniref:NADH-quinone oxidoreductase subunit n=1 Tax=Pseudonocardia sediminis TaxID=1397368 RepID=A0A4Q7UV54_PSEST|nr:NADH-quinone oxidoreductase subunit A [Pseudonocardia sediminis]RZT85666.1 NADH-quinone oxidoreductase subunit A [Pseudonocardia sediminis]